MAHSALSREYRSLPEAVRLHLCEVEYNELLLQIDSMHETGDYGLTNHTKANRYHHDLWNAATNPRCGLDDARALREFILDNFPQEYLEAMEEFRPMHRPINNGQGNV